MSVKKSSLIAASVSNLQWLRLTYNSEAVRLMMLTAKAYENESTGGTGRRLLNYMYESLSRTSKALYHYFFPMSNGVSMPTGYVAPKQTFENALRTDGMDTIREHLDGSLSLFLSDIGGQMEFQELLPLLVSGPSLFFIVFPLHRDLNELFTIEYELPDGQRSQPYQSSLIIKEAILQSLATIAAMGTFAYRGMKMGAPLKPKALLVGTHKDKLDPTTAQDKICEIDHNLQKMITSMSHYYDGLIVFASENRLILQ